MNGYIKTINKIKPPKMSRTEYWHLSYCHWDFPFGITNSHLPATSLYPPTPTKGSWGKHVLPPRQLKPTSVCFRSAASHGSITHSEETLSTLFCIHELTDCESSVESNVIPSHPESTANYSPLTPCHG